MVLDSGGNEVEGVCGLDVAVGVGHLDDLDREECETTTNEKQQ